MDQTELERKLIKAARGDTPSDAIPFLFARRVMARISVAPAVVADPLTAWAAALWRAAAPCAAIALLLGAWTAFEPESSAPDEFAQHFENTVLADLGADQSLE
jgi:hypothetical protein